MPTNVKVPAQHPIPISPTISLQDLAGILVQHYGLHEGIFDLMVEYQIGIGAVGPNKESLVPGAMIGISRVGLVPTTKLGPNTVDASKVNPGKKTRKKANT